MNPEVLLGEAVRILESGGLRPEDWSWGGGTALAIHCGHRDSEDIDIFLRDPQLLGRVSPRLNDVAGRAGSEYAETAGMVKIYAAAGQIDFITAARLTSVPSDRREFWGIDLFLERPVEIGAKKIFYRGDHLLARDIFDLAVIVERFGDDLRRESSAYASKISEAAKQLARMRDAYPSEAANLAIRKGFDKTRDDAVNILSRFFRDLSLNGS